MCEKNTARRCSDMNTILLSSLLCLACSVLTSLPSYATHASELGHVTVMLTSGEELQSAHGEEPESEDGPSGLLTGPPLGKGRGGRKKHSGKKKNKVPVSVRQRNSTPAQNLTNNPAYITNYSSIPDPCRTSHREYCIHGYCTYLHDLKEPVCVCLKGYDGVRCGIQLLHTGSGSGGQEHHHDDTVHITLIAITVILSVISCSALLLIICVHYRAQHRFQAVLLSATPEFEKLQKNIGSA